MRVLLYNPLMRKDHRIPVSCLLHYVTGGALNDHPYKLCGVAILIYQYYLHSFMYARRFLIIQVRAIALPNEDSFIPSTEHYNGLQTKLWNY